jgi:hypothetical protein
MICTLRSTTRLTNAQILVPYICADTLQRDFEVPNWFTPLRFPVL